MAGYNGKISAPSPAAEVQAALESRAACTTVAGPLDPILPFTPP